MLDLAFKNISRQKTRTSLTVIGIMIGIGAIVALGSISEGLRVMVTEQLEQASGMVMVIEESNSPIFLAMSTSKLSETTVNEIIGIDGIKEATPIVMDMGYLEEGQAFGQPTLFIVGVEPEKERLYTTETAKLKEGSGLEEGDVFYAVIGSDIADTLDLEVGDLIEVKETDFEVKGVYEEFGDSGIDSGVLIPLETAKDILETDEFSMVIVYPEDIDNVGELAETIEETVEDVSALSTEEFASQISSIINTIGIFTIGIAGISAIVGGLGVMNTMIMSVMERRREIGIMKAIGATRSFILNQILIESIAISVIGGIFGILIGSVGSYTLRFIAADLAAARVTPKLFVISISFATFLGVIGGLYPAWTASKLDPIEALRYE